MPGLSEGVVRAAGGIVWRTVDDRREVAIVHRPRYDDWTLPKGKLEPGEDWEEGAVREVGEETGFDVRREDFAGAVSYLAGETPKLVLFWNMAVEGEPSFRPSEEVDVLRWLSVEDAARTLTYAGERSLLACEKASSPSAPAAALRPARQPAQAELPFRTRLVNPYRIESAHRLNAEMLPFREELAHMARAWDGEPDGVRPWLEAADRLLDDAHERLERGAIDSAWRCFHAAKRMEIGALARIDPAMLRTRAALIRKEAGDKLQGWRKKTVETLMGDPETLAGTESDVMKVRTAAFVLHEHFANVYQRVEVIRRQIFYLALIGIATFGSWLVMLRYGAAAPLFDGAVSGLMPADTATAGTAPSAGSGSGAGGMADLIPTVVAFGILGGVISGIRSLSQKSSRKKIPGQLLSLWFMAARPLVGAVSAVVVFAALLSGLLAQDVISPELVVVFAFVAGFSERLLDRVVSAAAGE